MLSKIQPSFVASDTEGASVIRLDPSTIVLDTVFKLDEDREDVFVGATEEDVDVEAVEDEDWVDGAVELVDEELVVVTAAGVALEELLLEEVVGCTVLVMYSPLPM